MKRRDALAWLSRGLAAAAASVVAVPGVQYIAGTMQRAPSVATRFRRVARLADVPADRPQLVPILGQRQDAWIHHGEQVVGRVWLVRNAPRDGDASAEANGEVHAFTSLCPHMGCQIQLRAGGESFVCPCHKAAFGRDGSRLPASETGERNHAPRGMDRLETRVAQDETSGEWWVEVKYEKFQLGLTRQVPCA